MRLISLRSSLLLTRQFVEGWGKEVESVGTLERSSRSSATLCEEHGREERKKN
jgi:hypothetical protein